LELRKILLAAWGPIKAISIVWVFLIMIISFINFIFFDQNGLLNFLKDYPLTFNFLTVLISGMLFLFWLLVWNTLIKAFFKEDLQYLEKNGLKLEETHG
jgi:hypothetical protein